MSFDRRRRGHDWARLRGGPGGRIRSGRVFVAARPRTQFTDRTDRIFLGPSHIERAGPVACCSTGLFVLAFPSKKNLHTVFFPVANVNPAVFVRHDVVPRY